MSGVKAVRYLLAHYSPLLAVVPTERIIAGTMPENTALPAICVTHISTTRRHIIASSSNEYCMSRVQVTVLSNNYPEKQSILSLVRAALPRSRGSVNSVHVDSILLDNEGPDFMDEEVKIYIQSNDFIVNFIE